MRTALLLLLSWLLLPVAVECQQVKPPPPAVRYKLRELATYGWEETRQVAGLDERTIAAGGAMFGHIADLQLTPDGRVVVLDNRLRKVVAFDRAGTPKVLLTWREGKGPGEFTRARSIAFTSDGFALVDQSQPRITFFDLDGTFRKDVPFTGMALQVIATSDGYAVVRAGAPSRPVVVLLDSAGTVRDSLFPTTGRLADFTQWGELGRLFSAPAGTSWYASPAVGVLCPLARPARCGGTDIFPKVRGKIVNMSGQDVRMVAVGLRGAAAMSTGETVLLVARLEAPFHTWLLFLDKSGRYAGNLDLGEGLAARLSRGPREGELMIGFDDPYPHVKLYALERR